MTATQTPGGPRTLRVLLVSPCSELDPPSGDVTYTEELARRPPEGVEYVKYSDALRTGDLIEHYVRSAVKSARPSQFPRELAGAAAQKMLHLARSNGLLFREPFRFFSIRKNAFDIVHLHVFNAKFRNLDCPVVVSNANPLEFVYRDAFNWSGLRATVAMSIDRYVGRFLGVNMPAGHMPQATMLLPFSGAMAEWYRSHNFDLGKPVVAIPPGVETVCVRTPPREPKVIGFVATDFVAKGGYEVLACFRTLRTTRPDLRLLIVGSQALLSTKQLGEERITWMGRVPRAQLLSDILPSIDVFCYPSKFDGFPLTVLEALGTGIPTVVSDYFALPSIVEGSGAGQSVALNDPQALSAAVAFWLIPENNLAGSANARALYLSAYSPEVVSRALVNAYYHAQDLKGLLTIEGVATA